MFPAFLLNFSKLITVFFNVTFCVVFLFQSFLSHFIQRDEFLEFVITHKRKFVGVLKVFEVFH